MGRKVPFTEEQIFILEQNKYTHSVTPDRLVFTLEFKQFFVDQVRNHNNKTPAILRAAGYDTSFFGRRNLDKIREQILHEAASEKGLRPPKGLSIQDRIAAFEAKNLALQETEVSIKEMQERIVHLERQIEFLKKISKLNTDPPSMTMEKSEDPLP